MVRGQVLLLAATLCVGCSSKPEIQTPPERPQNIAERASAVGTVEVTAQNGEAYIVETTGLYLQASESRRVVHEGESRPNYQTTLYRGERIDVLKQGESFARVRVSDGMEGFVRRRWILEDVDRVATLLAESRTFKRPSLVSLSKRTLPVGTLLFVIGSKTEFVEVNFSGAATTWTLNEGLTHAVEDVSVSRVLNRVRVLKNSQKPADREQIEGLIAVARQSSPRSTLLVPLVAEVDPDEAQRLAAEFSAKASREKIPLSFSLHGSTPSLAWSPDSKRLLANAAYEYFGFEVERDRNRGSLGIHMIDTESGEMTRLWDRPGYHPVWLNEGQIAWGVSVYEVRDEKNSGLFVANLNQDRASVRRIVSAPGSVFNTHAARGGGVLFFANNWSPDAAWYRFDPREDQVNRLVEVGEGWGLAWDAPRQHVVSQCHESAGGVRAYADADGLHIEKKGDKVTLSKSTSLSFEPAGGSCDELEKHCGYVRPCLSPDGKRVAFVRPSDRRGDLTVEIYRL